MGKDLFRRNSRSVMRRGAASVLALFLLLGAHPALGLPEAGQASSSDLAEHVPGELLVGFEPWATRSDRAAAHSRAGGAVLESIDEINVQLVRLPSGKGVAEGRAAYRGARAVKFADPNYIRRASETLPNDPNFGVQWGHKNTGQDSGTPDADIDSADPLGDAWTVNTGSPDVVIAVIDTGTQITHPDLVDNIWVNPGEIPGNGIDDDGNGFIDDVNGWDFASNDNTVWDPGQTCSPAQGGGYNDDHGTHVSGIAGASGNNGIGVAGVNWNVKIMPLKFLTKSGGTCGTGTDANAIKAFFYAINNGAHVVNASWGGGGDNEALKQAMIAAGRAGILISAAGGNDGQDLGTTPVYPPSYDLENEIVVAASDRNDVLASWSNYGGPTDLAAPGVAIYSTYPENKYAYLSGTSMAAPFVAGAIALLKAQYLHAPASELKARLLDTVDAKPAFAAPKTQSGGRLNLNKAIRQARDVVPTVLSPNGGESLPAGGTASVEWKTNIPAGNPLKSYRVEYTTNSLSSMSESTGFEGSVPATWTQPADSDAPWGRTTSQARSGSESLMAPTSLEGNQGSWISTTKNFSAPGTVSFWWRVDSENCESGGQACGDYFRFHLDGYPLVVKAGFQDWKFESFDIPPGTHDLSWSYYKDPLDDVGEDTAWIDDVSITGIDSVSWSLAGTTDPGATSFSWSVPSVETTAAKVRVCEDKGASCAASASDTSDSAFTISTPVAGISLNHTEGSTTVTEGGSGDSYTVALNTQPLLDVTVSIGTNSQVTSSPSSLTFTSANWATPQTVNVSAVDDALDEDSPMVISLGHTASSLDSNYGGKTASIDVSVIDNDPTPTLSINDVSVEEGHSGTKNADFSLSLSAASGRTVSVNYATAAGSATSGADFNATSGTHTFSPGQTSKTITVQVKGDTLDEFDETYSVNLSGASNATIADSQGIGTIVDDDPEPSLSIDDVSVIEGNSGTTNANFSVTLSAASGKTVSVNYATAAGTATSGTDFTAASGTVSFSPGQTLKTITVAVKGDTADEFDETYFVNLSGASNATLSDSQGAGTIIDDDLPPAISVNDVSLLEGNSGTTSFVFTVSLSAASGKSITVNYTTADGTASAPEDFTATSGTLTFNPGEASKQITVAVNGDTTVESDEEFYLDLSGASNASISDARGVGTILTDDTPGVAIVQSDGTTTVRETGATSDTYQVFLRAQPTSDVVVSVLPDSQVTVSSGSLTFTSANWSTPQTVTVTAVDDQADEPPLHWGSVTHSLESEDGRYHGLAVSPVNVEVTDNDVSGYWVESNGAVHRFGDASTLTIFGASSLPGLARSIAALPGTAGGYVLDGYGGMHPFGTGGGPEPGNLDGAPYFAGFDIARKMLLRPAGGAYFLDGWGGVHPAAGAPSLTQGTLPYFQGFDIARSMVLTPSGTGGYLLDGFGGPHPFGIGGSPAPGKATGVPYFAGSDIARDIAVMPDGSGGFILDGAGGIHRFGIGSGEAPPPIKTVPNFYKAGTDTYRAIVILPDGSGGHVMDSAGRMHPFAIGENAIPPQITSTGAPISGAGARAAASR